MNDMNSFYNKIRENEEIFLLLKKLVYAKGKILMKIDLDPEGSALVLMTPLGVDWKKEFEIKLEFDVSRNKRLALISETQARPVVYHFVSEGKKIVGLGHVGKLRTRFVLYVQSPIFFVQRRENFRLRLPSSFGAYCRIVDIDPKARFRIDNISAGGLLLEDERLPQDMSVGHVLSLDIYLSGREPIYLRAMTRRYEGGQKPKLGLKFHFENKKSQRDMLELMLDLYRRFFK
jgi:c-di-GMP-binding flagellar brake protein YcgR